MKKVIVVKADMNDADYIEASCEINETLLAELRPVFEAIKEYSKVPLRGYASSHNWETSEYGRNGGPKELYAGILTSHQIDLMNDYVPYGECGVHTIKSIKILTIADEEQVL